MKKLPEPFFDELYTYYEEDIINFFSPTFPGTYTPEEMQKCLEMLYVYGYKF